MALVLKDRVRETTTTQGTGTVTLAGAVAGFQSFSAIGNANTTYYTINLPGVNEWEVGIGTYTASGTTLSRDTVLASSNSGNLVNFSAGTKDVFCTYPAGRSVYYDTATNVTLNQLSATTVDTTNLEVTNIKAKDGTASITLADSTGNVTVSPAFAVNGNTTLGDASTDTVQVNGYMGVGAAVNSGIAVRIGSSALAGAAQRGAYSDVTFTSASTTRGAAFESNPSTAAASFTVADVMGFSAQNVAALGAGSTITNQHGVYVNDQTRGTNNYGVTSRVSSGTNKWNIYASGTAANYFAGITTFNAGVGIGGSASPSSGQSVEITYGAIAGTGRVMAYDRTGAARLPLVLDGQPVTLTHNNVTRVATSSTGVDVTGALTVSGNTTLGDASTDTVTVNGYMGIGGAGSAAAAIRIDSNALSGTSQDSILAYHTGTSGATANIRGVVTSVNTAVAAYTVTNVAGFWAANAGKGAGSTITNLHGLYIADQTQGTNNYGITSLVSSGTNKWNIYASGTAANYFAGNVGIGTSSPVSVLDVAGTTPVLTIKDTQSKTWAPNDTVGDLDFYSTDPSGTGPRTVARVRSVADANATTVAGALSFWTSAADSAATEKVRITSAGNVGIGTNTPASELEVLSTDSATAIRVSSGAASTTTGTSTLRLQAFNSASGVIGSAEISNTAPAGGQSILTFATSPSGNAPTERMRIDSSGNVGIGTNTPTNKLTVDGNANVTGNTTLGDATTDTVTVNGYMGVGGAVDSTSGIKISSVALTGTTQRGLYVLATSTDGATNSFRGIQTSINTPNSAFTMANAIGFYAATGAKGAASTVTNWHGIYIDDQTQGTNNFGITSLVSSGSNKWNIYASGTAANYFAGNVGIGVASPGVKLDIKQSGANWYDGARIVRSTNDNQRLALGNTSGAGYIAAIDAAGGTNNVLLLGQSTDGTTFIERVRVSSTEAVFNDTSNDYDFRVESDTNTHALFVEGTNSNVKIGGSAERATTVGTNHLDIFDGTAPVGTLANGISIYSAAGEAYVMDAAGNATLFSPHDRETNEWIFKSKHTPTGKVLKIDVERLLKFVNDHFGLDAVHEFIED